MKLSNQSLTKIKGELSFSEIMNNDQNNIANHYNTHRYRQLLEGNIKSPAITYLLNMGHMGVSDYKTLDYFNKKMIAIKEMEVGELSELHNNKTFNLNTKYKSKKIRISEILNHRKSTRKYIPVKLGFNKFSRIVNSLCNTDSERKYMDLTVPARGYASGGGLYPIISYLLVLNVEGLKKGWYKLQPNTHSIQLIKEINGKLNSKIISGKNIELRNSCFALFYGYDLSKSYPKYGESSLQLGLIEVGEISQLVDMVATSLSLGSCQSAGFDKSLIQKALKIDGITNQIIHAQIIGEKNE